MFDNKDVENKCTICEKDAPALFHLKTKARNGEAGEWYISDEYACGQCAYNELHEYIAKEKAKRPDIKDEICNGLYALDRLFNKQKRKS